MPTDNSTRTPQSSPYCRNDWQVCAQRDIVSVPSRLHVFRGSRRRWGRLLAECARHGIRLLVRPILIQQVAHLLRIGLIVVLAEGLRRRFEDLVFGCRDVETENVDDPVGQVLRQLIAQQGNDYGIARQHNCSTPSSRTTRSIASTSSMA